MALNNSGQRIAAEVGSDLYSGAATYATAEWNAKERNEGYYYPCRSGGYDNSNKP